MLKISLVNLAAGFMAAFVAAILLSLVPSPLSWVLVVAGVILGYCLARWVDKSHPAWRMLFYVLGFVLSSWAIVNYFAFGTVTTTVS